METVIIGGGPSVTPEQIEAVRKWRGSGKDRVVCVVNRAFEEIDWADYCFSRDTKFLHSFSEGLEKWPGQVLVGNRTFTPPWTRLIPGIQSYISGAAAIEAMAKLGCTVQYLIGADGHHKGGEHWFKNYEDLKNAPNIDKWNEYYAEALRHTVGVDVYNLSPGTAVTAVPTADFEEMICHNE